VAKTKTVYVCQNCGAKEPKWMGRCTSCGEWNTFTEEIETKNTTKHLISQENTSNIPVHISDIKTNPEKRIPTNISEFDRVLGGGLVPGSVILIGGEPGIGKSTLLLQFALNIQNKKTLYISGEESNSQIKLRAERIDNTKSELYLLSETSLENILLNFKKFNPEIIIIDSIQTIQTQKLESSAGTVSQIRECTIALMEYAKTYSVPILLVGHINKEGNIAGPKVLEHIVDVVLQFEGDRNYVYRILRAHKNRFGSASELGIFEMHSKGLREVLNPSELLLSQNNNNVSGVSVASGIEGLRAFLIEIQALVSSAVYGTPQRTTTGFDNRRLSMLLAVLEKKAGFKLGTKDVFLNIAGGLKVDDPAIDLSIIVAVLSSDLDIAINKTYCFAGEVGLTGEVRPVSRLEQRIMEAEKLGFTKIFVPEQNKKSINTNNHKINIIFVSKVENVFSKIFSQKA
jgi:DNA repair protein RadA/Sms